jgi:formylglycine-generating enzyme required for sulfatase activity
MYDDKKHYHKYEIEEGIMKKIALAFLIVFCAGLLSSCITNPTPTENPVQVKVNYTKTFKVSSNWLYPKFSWTLDSIPVTGQQCGSKCSSFQYTPTSSDVGLHYLVAGDSKTSHTWTIVVSEDTGPIGQLLNSLVHIPAGSFMMGDSGYSYSSPVHQVTLSDFYIGAYELTQAQYETLMGSNPSHFQDSGSENKPVEMVTMDDAKDFCVQLSELTGRTFTLPSEAQWEYACRAGSTTVYSFGDSSSVLGNYAWYRANSGNTTNLKGTKLPNPWNLYDMHGNVWEWCLDSWHDNYTGAPSDGSAWEPETGTNHVTRGGSWADDDVLLRSAYRTYHVSNIGYDHIGFRVVAIP